MHRDMKPDRDSVDMTVINGVVYDADSMDQLWPRQLERGTFYFQQ